MSEWWTYSLTDFLLFSPRTYYRLFELYNEAVWPAHVAAFVLAAAIVYSALRRDGRAIGLILGGIWLWVAVAFHLDRYSSINWAASYMGMAFALQAALIVRTGYLRDKLAPQPDPVALALIAFAVVVQPVIGPLLGRDWAQAEIFGLAPDPTAVATLGVLLLDRRPHWHLLAIPLLWCVFTGLTLWAMEAPDAWVSPAAAGLALVASLWKSLRAN